MLCPMVGRLSSKQKVRVQFPQQKSNPVVHGCDAIGRRTSLKRRVLRVQISPSVPKKILQIFIREI